MGLIVDRLAQAVEKLRLVQQRLIAADNDEAAQAIQDELIDPLQEISLDLDGTPADQRAQRVEEAYYRTASKPSPRARAKQARMSWSCCHAAHRTVTRSGKRVWVADCKWTRGDRTGQAARVIGEGSRPLPKRIKIGRRTMKRC
jgi:hypothetical protein